jgi:GNAT superfamily N-acetyltransferase
VSILLANTRPEHIAQLVEHQRRCFPTINPDDLMSAEAFAAQIAVFPEGQHVALDGDMVVAQSSTFRIDDRCLEQHTYREITAGNTFHNHDPTGRWLYGADMSVHPDYRGRGIGTSLYTLRKKLVRSWGMRGIMVAGATPGYYLHAGRLSVDEYIAEVVAGRMFDPTLSVQLKNGFVVRDVLRKYVDGGELVGDDATLLVWEVD